MAHCEKTFPLCFGGARLDGSTATLDGDGEKVHDHFFGQSSFATYALASERNVVKVSRDVPLERLGPLGCGIQTGAGAVMTALNVRPGTSFASSARAQLDAQRSWRHGLLEQQPSSR